MFERNLQYIGPLEFDVNGFAINPFTGENVFNAKDFRDLMAALVGTGVVHFHGTIQETPPDFNAASVIGNIHAEIVTADYSIQNTYYDGVTGVTVTASTKIVELNTNLLTWFGIERSVDTVDVILTVSDNL